jgi:large subunit ribosomal protein L10
MPNKKNQAELQTIQEKKDQAKSVIFAHYAGLGVNQMNDLRQKIKDAGGELVVAKNTLLRIAFGDQTLSEALVGPTVTVFSYEDEIAPLKAVAQFEKDNELPTFTAGYMDAKSLSREEVVQLAKLPGKLELQAQLVGTLAAPMSGLLNVFQGNTRNLVYALKAIQEQKAQN